MSPQAVRVRTSSGWQDIALTGPPGPAGGATQLIQEIVLASAGQFVFSSIPQIYTDLRLVLDVRGNVTGSGGLEIPCFRLNDYAGNGYNTQGEFSYGTTVTATVDAPAAQGYLGNCPDNTGDAAVRGYQEVVFPSYRSVQGYRSWYGGGNSGAPGNGGRRHEYGGLAWGVGAGAAITKIFVFSFFSGNNFAAGSRAALYGVGSSGPQTGIPFVTSLPANPINGQEIYYQADAANGIVWHLRYNAGSASAYKWEAIGSSPLVNEVPNDEGLSGTTAYSDVSTGGPSVTVPLAGDYVSEFGCAAYHTVSADTIMVLKRGASVSVDADSARATHYASSRLASFSRILRLSGLAANTVLKCQYASSTTNACSFRWRWLTVTPIRVG